jgi:hypothetical protein
MKDKENQLPTVSVSFATVEMCRNFKIKPLSEAHKKEGQKERSSEIHI